MNRLDCVMSEYIGNTLYCGYFDAGFMVCSKNPNCPEEDEDEDNQEYEYEDGFGNW